MAKKQSRRTISLNRAVYDLAIEEAHKRGISASQLVELGLKRLGLKLPKTEHVSPEAVRKMRERRWPSSVSAGYTPIARSRTVHGRRIAPVSLPSRERQILGDKVADMLGVA